jgi:hypothetical protein
LGFFWYGIVCIHALSFIWWFVLHTTTLNPFWDFYGKFNITRMKLTIQVMLRAWMKFDLRR